MSNFSLISSDVSLVIRYRFITPMSRFPPSLWIHLADMWNKSLSPFLICYHGPRDIIECYEFNVELITQISTSMHGSKESHTGYIYRRSRAGSKVGSRTNVMQLEQNFDMPCDPYYKEALIKAKSGASSLKEEVFSKVNAVWDSSPSTRSGRGPRR